MATMMQRKDDRPADEQPRSALTARDRVNLAADVRPLFTVGRLTPVSVRTQTGAI